MANIKNENCKNNEDVKSKFIQLCMEMNIESTVRDETWQIFQQTNLNITLEVSLGPQNRVRNNDEKSL